MKNCSEARISVAPNVQCQLVDNQAVLLNPQTRLHLDLSPKGVRMWTALTNSSSLRSAYDSLLTESDVQPAQLRNDLCDFVGQLWLQSLIEIGADARENEFEMAPAVAAVS